MKSFQRNHYFDFCVSYSLFDFNAAGVKRRATVVKSSLLYYKAVLFLFCFYFYFPWIIEPILYVDKPSSA